MIQPVSGLRGRCEASDSCAPQRRTRSADMSVRRTASASLETRGALELTTKDGDRVSISFSALDRLSTAAASRGQQVSAEAKSRSAVSVNVKVEGTIDDQELADITKLMERLGAAAGGDGAPVDIGSLDSLDQFDFSLNRSASFDYSQRVRLYGKSS